MGKHTELLDYIINPSFLELMKQSADSVQIEPYFSIKTNRQGRTLTFTFYTSGDGQVNISDTSRGGLSGAMIIRDFCQTPEDFRKMLEKLDDLLIRFPKYEE